MAVTCKMCGTANPDGIQFCQACGSAISGNQAEPAREAQRRKAAPAKTMMFGQAPQVPPAQAPPDQVPVAQAPPAQAPAAAPKAAAGPARTMLGIQSPVAQAQTAAPAAVPQAQPAPMARPVMTAPAAAPTEKQSMEQKRTMLGMPAVTGSAVEEAIAQAKAQAAAAATPAVAKRPEDIETIASAPAVTVDQPAARARPETAPLEPIIRQSHAADQPVAAAESWNDDDLDGRPAPRRGPGLLIIAIVAGVLIIAGVAVLLYLLVWKGGDDLRAQVFQSPTGGGVTVVLPLLAAPPGAVVQVDGQQVPVLGGQARFDLPMARLKLGTNDVQVTYTAPGKPPEIKRFPITLRHTATDDPAGLAMAEPYFEVVFQTVPGIQLAVANTPVQAVGGVYRHRVALSQVAGADDPKADSLIHTVPFALTEQGGAAEQGQHVVTLPLPRLQIDRPGVEAMVVRDEVTVAGTAEEGAQVTVNGQPVGVTAAGFATQVHLPELGEHVIRVTARSLGKAPRTRQVKVTRIADLAPFIEEWSGDLNRKLDYPTIARDPSLYAEQKVVLSGRVVNINTEKGVTAFLLYIGEGCPTGARCAVYVDYAGETDAGLQSNVTVYGTVGGTRDVDLRGGGKETMPSIKARFVVIDTAAKKPARR